MVYLIDASVYVFRAWFSIDPSMTNARGEPVNAVYGFTRFLCEFLERAEPERCALAFDESLTTSFRNEIYPDYKANRELPPEELERQFTWCRRVGEALGLPCYSDARYEADDIMGTLARHARDAGLSVVLVTRDKDLSQVLRAGDVYWDYAGDRRIAYEEAAGHFGVRPESMADYLALVGDKVDNIAGVPGVGPKTAAAILGRFPDLDDAYANLDRLAELKVRGAGTLGAKLAEHRDAAFLARRLTTIATDMDIDAGRDTLRVGAVDARALEDVMDELGFGRGLKERLGRLSGVAA